jgi:ureidoglycolate hydrolase
MPLKWQEQFVALLEQAYEMGVRTPGFSVSMKDPDTNRFCKIPEQWLNYRHGTLRAAMATMKEDDL